MEMIDEERSCAEGRDDVVSVIKAEKAGAWAERRKRNVRGFEIDERSPLVARRGSRQGQLVDLGWERWAVVRRLWEWKNILRGLEMGLNIWRGGCRAAEAFLLPFWYLGV